MTLDVDTRYFTNSELWAFKRCRRRWWLSFYRKLEKIHTSHRSALMVGTRVHRALQCEYQPGERRDLLECYEQNWRDERAELLNEGWDEEALKEIEKDVDLGRAMIEGFKAWRQETGVDAGLEITAAEEKVDVESGIFGVRLLGKLDVRGYRKSDGARLYIDHKTCGSLTQYRQQAPRNRQFLHYHLLELLKLMEEHPGVPTSQLPLTVGTAVNAVRKVKRTQKAKPPFYERIDVYHSLEELRSYYVQVHGEIRDVLDVSGRLDEGASHHEVCYPTPDSSCDWQCPYVEVCPLFDDGSDAEGYIARYLRSYDPNERYETDLEESDSE